VENEGTDMSYRTKVVVPSFISEDMIRANFFLKTSHVTLTTPL